MSKKNRSMFSRRRVRNSVVLLGVLFVVGMVATGGVAAQEPVGECQILDTPGETYELNQSITNSTTDTCLDITADDVTLDGNGHTVDGVNQTTDSIGVLVNSANNVTVKNFGNVTRWQYGIVVGEALNSTLTDNTANANSRVGIYMLTIGSTLTRNTANDNGLNGVHLTRGSSENTLTDNTANNNGEVGILVEGSNDNLLELNEANENKWGIIVIGTQDNEIVENVASRNEGETGSEQLPSIISDFPGIGIKIAGSLNTNVDDNEANQNKFTGISVLDSYSTRVDNNDVHQNGVSENGDGFGSQFGSGIGVFRVGFFGDSPEARSITPASHTPTTPNRITDNDATGNQVGITLLGATNNTLSDNTATENFVGIQTFDAFNNTFTDDTSRNNIEFDYMDMTGYFFFGDSLDPADSLEPNDIESPGVSDLNTVENLNIGNSEKPNTEVSFKTVNFVLRGTSAQPPANPKAEATGRYFETAPTFFLGGGPIGGEPIQDPIEPQQLPSALLDIDLHYKNSDVQGINESSLGLWGYESFGGWINIEDEPGFGETGVDEQKNVVSLNATLNLNGLSQNQLSPQSEGEVSPTQVPLVLFGAFGETACVNRRNLGRGQEDSECPFDRDIDRGGSREELDRDTGRGGDGDHRDSATSRRNRGR